MIKPRQLHAGVAKWEKRTCQLLGQPSAPVLCGPRKYPYQVAQNATRTYHVSRSIREPVYKPQQLTTKGLAQFTTNSHANVHAAPSEPVIHPVFEANTGTWQYVVADPSTNEAVIIDPVLDYDASTCTASTHTADNLLALIHSHSYTVDRILETHAHADHLTAAAYLQLKLGAAQAHRNHRPPLICIGRRIGIVQTLFGQRYGVPADERAESAFDTLLDDDEQFVVGRALRVTALHLPGHTPDHLGYMFGGAHVFCGDSLFHPDIGSARCDFPGGSVRDLYASARRLLALPAAVRIWPGHDYPPPPPVKDDDGTKEEGHHHHHQQHSREPVSWATVVDHRRENRHLRDGISEEEFVTMRGERDARLGAPRLLHQALQMNIRAGRLPRPTPGFGDRLLHVPMRLGPGVGEW